MVVLGEEEEQDLASNINNAAMDVTYLTKARWRDAIPASTVSAEHPWIPQQIVAIIALVGNRASRKEVFSRIKSIF